MANNELIRVLQQTAQVLLEAAEQLDSAADLVATNPAAAVEHYRFVMGKIGELVPRESLPRLVSAQNVGWWRHKIEINPLPIHRALDAE